MAKEPSPRVAETFYRLACVLGLELQALDYWLQRGSTPMETAGDIKRASDRRKQWMRGHRPSAQVLRAAALTFGVHPFSMIGRTELRNLGGGAYTPGWFLAWTRCVEIDKPKPWNGEGSWENFLTPSRVQAAWDAASELQSRFEPGLNFGIFDPPEDSDPSSYKGWAGRWKEALGLGERHSIFDHRLCLAERWVRPIDCDRFAFELRDSISLQELWAHMDWLDCMTLWREESRL